MVGLEPLTLRVPSYSCPIPLHPLWPQEPLAVPSLGPEAEACQEWPSTATGGVVRGGPDHASCPGLSEARPLGASLSLSTQT